MNILNTVPVYGSTIGQLARKINDEIATLNEGSRIALDIKFCATPLPEKYVETIAYEALIIVGDMKENKQ